MKLRQVVRDTPPRPSSLPKKVYDIVGTITTLLLFNFMAAPFMVCYWRDTIEVWSRMGWYGFWIVGLGYAFFSSGGTKLCKNLKEERLRKAEKDLIGIEEYVHPMLRTKGVEDIQMNSIPPVDGVMVEKVIKKHRRELRKKQ